MKAIVKREIRAYFQNVIGWLFVAAILALYGLYFFVYNLNAGYPYISYPLSDMSFILMLAAPVLTMRSLAEERRSKTDQLLLTAPVSVGRILLGKYCAMAFVYTVPVAVIAMTPLLLALFGTVPMAESYTAVFGFWLYGLSTIAIGMLISSLTESQVIAAVVTFAALFLGYMMQGISGLLSDSAPVLAKLLNAYNLYTPLQQFMNGCFDLSAGLYFLSLIGLCLFLCGQVIQKRRFCISKGKLSPGIFSLGMIAAAFGLVIAANLVVRELPTTITAIDVTSTKLYSITEETKAYLQTLEEEVSIYVLAAEKNADATLAETLERYEDLSGHIQVEYKNPAVNPNFYQQYTDSAPSSNSLIVVSAKRARVIDYSEIYEYSIDYTTYSQSLDGYDAEGQLTSAIQYVTMEDTQLPVIYELQGHGEAALSGGFTEAIEKANIKLSELTLLTEEAVPEDAAILIHGPSSDFSEDDKRKVLAYLEKGGKAIITTSFQYQELPNFNSILEEYGVERIPGIVMENDGAYYYQGIPYYLLPEVTSSDYTASVVGSYIFMPYSEGFSYDEASEEISYTPLLTTSEQAVAKADAANAQTSELEEGDTEGPFVLALAAEGIGEETAGQLFLLGAAEMLTEEADQMVSGANAALFADIVTAAAGEEMQEASVIPVKEYTLGMLTVNSTAGLYIGLGTMLVLPLLLLTTGIVIWGMRRRK